MKYALLSSNTGGAAGFRLTMSPLSDVTPRTMPSAACSRTFFISMRTGRNFPGAVSCVEGEGRAAWAPVISDALVEGAALWQAAALATIAPATITRDR